MRDKQALRVSDGGRRPIVGASEQIMKRSAGTVLLALVAMALGLLPLSASSQTTEAQSAPEPIEILYLTNRAPVTLENGAPSYGAGRSHSLAFGTVTVVGDDVATAGVSVPTELGRFPSAPYRLERTNGVLRRSPAVMAEHARAQALLVKELTRRVRDAGRHEAVVFIHGYNNSFEDAARSVGQLCNDLGPKDYLCVAITWPAGGTRGALFGYNFDRESGEFAVPDVRKAVRAIGMTPGLRKLHFIAHSRGTDVLSTALQQLAIESYASQSSMAGKLKIANIVLAAPDLDMDVAFARMLGTASDPEAPSGKAPNHDATFNPEQMHLTIYASQKDRALEMSKALFGSETRLGLMDSHAKAEMLELVAQTAGVADFISVENGGGLIGHSYFLSSPEVRADLTALIRDGRKPGDDGRALVELQHPFWILPGRPR
jgi:esterase/lipase superfamily enzyme